ncbi:MAG: ATPase [Actinomycetes bacterium]
MSDNYGYDDELPPEVYEELPVRDLDIEGYLRGALDIVDRAKAMPLSSSVMVSKEEISGLILDALDRIPEEIRQARWVLKEREEMAARQQREADLLMDEVRAQAERMVSRTEVVRQARIEAQRVIDAADDEARRLRMEADDYCDQKLAGMEIALDRILRTVQEGRQRLAPSIDAQFEEVVDAAQIGDNSSDDGFFDQDL